MPAHPDPALTTADVDAALEASGKPLHVWGAALDGTPMRAARTGGDRRPALFITAGAHCTETAGVHAALHLLAELDTEHEVHVLPLRDPLGFRGADACLSLAAREPVHVSDPDAALALLRDRAEILWSEGDLYLFRLGEVGFAWAPPRPGLETFWRQFALTGRLPREAPEALVPLRGRSIFFLHTTSDTEGADALQRAYHTVLGADGQWLHMNRFFGRPDAPPEVAAVDDLVRTVEPGLTIDLHEGNGEGFWLPIPRPERDEDLARGMAEAFFGYIEAQGYPVEAYEHWQATNGIEAPDPDWLVPDATRTGLFWLRQDRRQEGPNLMTYAARWGLGYGTEGPMGQPLVMRVDGLVNGMLRAIRVWEQGR